MANCSSIAVSRYGNVYAIDLLETSVNARKLDTVGHSAYKVKLFSVNDEYYAVVSAGTSVYIGKLVKNGNVIISIKPIMNIKGFKQAVSAAVGGNVMLVVDYNYGKSSLHLYTINISSQKPSYRKIKSIDLNNLPAYDTDVLQTNEGIVFAVSIKNTVAFFKPK